MSFLTFVILTVIVVMIILIVVAAGARRSGDASPSQVTCRHCGAGTPAHARFCRKCGKQIT